MHPLIRLKTIDIIGQISMLALPYLGYGIIRISEQLHLGINFGLLTLLLTPLFTVGAWQCCSALITITKLPKQYQSNSRRAYNMLLCGIMVMAVTIFFIGLWAAFGFLMLLLVFAPVMGVWYFLISVDELLKVRAALKAKKGIATA